MDPADSEPEARGSDTIDLSAFTTGAVINLSTIGLFNSQTVGLQSVIAGQVQLILLGSLENIIGTATGDTLTGSSESNRMEGRGGNDTLIGQDGDDTLEGGTGDDTLDGGTGDDLYVFSTTSAASLGVDTLAAFASNGKPIPKISEKIAIPGYKILGKLGRGAMGIVYKAHQTRADRTVALKVMLNSVQARTEEVSRFKTRQYIGAIGPSRQWGLEAIAIRQGDLLLGQAVSDKNLSDKSEIVASKLRDAIEQFANVEQLAQDVFDGHPAEAGKAAANLAHAISRKATISSVRGTPQAEIVPIHKRAIELRRQALAADSNSDATATRKAELGVELFRYASSS